jgi:hypothetical protein
MIWAFNARRASLSEALHIVSRLPPAKAHNNISSSSSSSNDDMPIATSTLKQQMDMNLYKEKNALTEADPVEPSKLCEALYGP